MCVYFTYSVEAFYRLRVHQSMGTPAEFFLRLQNTTRILSGERDAIQREK